MAIDAMTSVDVTNSYKKSVPSQTDNKTAVESNTTTIKNNSNTQNIGKQNVNGSEGMLAGDQLQNPDSQIKGAVEAANKKLEELNVHCDYSYNDVLNRVVVKVVNDSTNKVVKEIPSDEMIKTLEKITELAGLLVDETL